MTVAPRRSVRRLGANRAYQAFWAGVGRTFPDLGGARSTRQYLDDEQWLLRRAFGTLEGRRLLKTDLWDEAKNTRILRWAAAEGATAVGVDISRPIVAQARAEFDAHALPLRGVVADVRRIPFRTASFDAVYSMGTIEHFAESQAAVGEMFRVLRPGGRAVIGVPNLYDPFLRPLMVAGLARVGLYGYGYEKAFSRRALRMMLERAGFRVVDETGILFLPGWLRMLDLALHCWTHRGSWLTAAAVAPFSALSRRVPRLRRHGYLLATVADKPSAGCSAGGASR